VDHCYKCHSDGAAKLKGGLKLDSLAAILAGGDTGPSIVPGDANHSLLITAVRYKDKDLEMPPKGKLPDDAIKALEQWVAMGAPHPDALAPTAPTWTLPRAASSGATRHRRRTHRRWWSTVPGCSRPSTSSSSRAWRPPGLHRPRMQIAAR
ncbi:MAG: hypothetical protein EBU31_10335, partial [Proteobacteria bacterium]|nr:hypothetical protein [Pseudomonadota bacterium]